MRDDWICDCLIVLSSLHFGDDRICDWTRLVVQSGRIQENDESSQHHSNREDPQEKSEKICHKCANNSIVSHHSIIESTQGFHPFLAIL